MAVVATSGSGAGAASLNLSLSTSIGAAAEEPCLSCVEDPACWQNPMARTAQNFISVCRTGHGVFFLAYALLLIIIIIMVWLTSNGSIGSTVNAWVCTFISVVVIILMALHWGLYVKGVIPSCCSQEGCVVYEEAEPAAAGIQGAFAIQSGAGVGASAPAVK
jgi:hypothetical protein